jgi:hypothetical protein
MGGDDQRRDEPLTPILSTNPPLSERLPPLKVAKSNWVNWLSAAISITLLVIMLGQLRKFGFARAWEALPASPWFWMAFAGYYITLPVIEWIIYRRLWLIPLDGLAALFRKLVSNEILLGYSGEAYFYTWARRRAKMVAAPFGAIKDVSILSAMAGNIVTLTMLAIAYPIVGVIGLKFDFEPVFLSAAFIVSLSTLLLLFRSRIFSLPRRELGFIFAMHMLRLVVTTFLTVSLWRTGLPEVPMIWLVFLVTTQLLVTRLPFVTNKEVVFAGLASLLVGNDAQIATLIATIATAILATHLCVGSVLVLAELFAVRRK